MKLYIDDNRDCPDGWVLARTGMEAYHLIHDNKHKITHISFDYYLGFNQSIPTCGKLIREIGMESFYEDEPIFTKEMKFLFHSSDNEKNRLMHRMIQSILKKDWDELDILAREV